MSITEICELGGLIATGIGFIISAYHWFKEKRWNKVKSFIEEKMIEAEKQDGLSGVSKLKYVLLACKEEYGKVFEHLESKVRAYIEECIQFSKNVNSK